MWGWGRARARRASRRSTRPITDAIAAILEARAAAGRGTILIALHSFTPAMGGVARPWHAGVLHDAGDTRFALAVLAGLGREGDLIVGDNQPYRMDGTDHSVPRHCYPRGLPYLELEIRQDLIAQADGQIMWARRLARLFAAAKAKVDI